jgi:four helix bundle protein
MRYKRFEDVPVWNTAIELAIGVYLLTSKPEFEKRYSLKDQLERAAVSVSNNIAEGFERGTNNELVSFLYISRGSAGESRSILCLLDRLPGFAKLHSDIATLRARAESCSRQLKAWVESLQNSDLKGERFVTARVRRGDQNIREREEFLRELAEIRNKSTTSSK